MSWSTRAWSSASSPITSVERRSLTAATAFRTPLPPKRFLSPSRSSSASRSPVEAPEGTAARPMAPPSSTTSTSTVGLPRLSRISRAKTESMVVIDALLCYALSVIGLDEALLAGGDHHHPALGDAVPTAVLGGVVPDEAPPGHLDPAVDDRPAYARVAVDHGAGQ